MADQPKDTAGERPKELIAWLKANSGKATLGMRSASAARPDLRRVLSSRRQTGTQFQFVPYRGGAPLLQDD